MDTAEALKPRKRTPVIEIGCRHHLEHRVFHDQATGEYQEMNAIPQGHMALLQYALCPALLLTKHTLKSRRLSAAERHAHVGKWDALS